MPPESAIEAPATAANPAGTRPAHGGRFSAWRQALRMARRDWIAGELYLLLFALVLAVAALTSVGFMADRMRLGLERDARQMIASDVLLVADQPFDAAFAQRAQAAGLAVAQTVTFPSMATANGKAPAGGDAPSQLAALKAVTDGYPLRGKLKVASAAGAPDAPAEGIPAPGTVWVDEALLGALGVAVGDTLQLGSRSFRIDRIITQELDRGTGFMNFAPRVLMPLSDLDSTGLIGWGSRVTYRLLVAGPDAAGAAFQKWAQDEIGRRKLRNTRVESLESGQPQMRATLDRAERFLSLVAVLSSMIAAVAIAMSARRYMQRHTDACAVYKCLGLSRGQILRAFGLEFLLVGAAGALAGVLLGYLAHYGLLLSLGGLLRVSLPQPSLLPALVGVLAGLVLLAGFALPPLLALARVAPLRVLRRDIGLPPVSAWVAYALGLGAFVALLLVAARDLRLGLTTAGGFVAAGVVFAVLALGLLTLLSRLLRGRLRGRAAMGWRFALAVLERRRAVTVLQTVALAVGLMALLLLGMTRNDLVDSWRQATPADAPNRFIINIQPDQREPLRQMLAGAGINDLLYPMVRGRLTHIGERAIRGDSFEDGRARNLVEREFNLSYTDALPEGNRVIAGRWSNGPDAGASVEEGIAKTLGIRLGDTLRFDVAGQAVQARVTSLRKLDWGSMRVNFFVILPPQAMQGLPETYITSFHLPPASTALGNRLIAAFPNITVVNTDLILRQIQDILDQVIAAVEFLFVFTLAAGVTVLYAALSGARDERMRDAGLLKALGASAALVRQTQYAEFLVVGGLAGFLASLGAIAVGWGLSQFVFDFPYRFNAWIVPVGVVSGMLCAFAGGWLGLREVLRQPALATLRDA
ncbi:putative ABC-type transport system involved in lysophospholipase L1 biosynthesis, permease component [Cupriavidus necator]|uniref:ABC-type transporter involved in lysophospholipase L1 biosynthesis, permease component n=1 Tax=Cupriavidus necator (strain ATCC 17699 / DSM 428 / KCTC 22496 / NCIMB 10442 / H16 / Stanier 337) TaxID=381666 RepID=Q0KCV7_CUPNH|nr:FtsX-like permease family protein [Cupriavidus necator]QCC00074.1 FtsX-like permease family protein [Cupriavidus necator H16]QQB77112.1 FtsX-like permease family protein [Cupriavidus necator]WKA41927.1 FtsX-like permease family protein [Cupriavidus necator]CAJ92164.1 ABC-type transporter involved in lysophospholipase L1 biosynthesis, permease component [Cupriavidus necator H16]